MKEQINVLSQVAQACTVLTRPIPFELVKGELPLEVGAKEEYDFLVHKFLVFNPIVLISDDLKQVGTLLTAPHILQLFIEELAELCDDIALLRLGQAGDGPTTKDFCHRHHSQHVAVLHDS